MKNFIHFRHMRSFLMLWASQAVSTMGSAMTSFALLIWVYQQEGTATSIALLSFFSTRDTLQYSTIPISLFLGGWLADNVFEPFMAKTSAMQGFFTLLVGEGKGSGMAVMLLFTGLIGCLGCLAAKG